MRVFLGIGEQGPPGPPGTGANWRGIYNAGTTYAVKDGVDDGSGNLFVSNIDGNVGNAPDTHNTGEGSGTEWSPMAQADAIIDSSGNGTDDWAVVKEAPLNVDYAEYAGDLSAALVACANFGGEIYVPGSSSVRSFASTLAFPGGTAQPAITMRGDGPDATVIQYTGSGYAVQFGDGGANDQRWQWLTDLMLEGTSAAAGGIKHQETRWCGGKRLHLRGFSNGLGVWIMPGYANYFNEYETITVDATLHGFKLEGDVSGTGANSNRISKYQSGPSIGGHALWIAGGDTNTLLLGEIASGDIYIQGQGSYGNTILNKIIATQFDGGGGVTIADSNCTDTMLLGNTGPDYTVSDSGSATVQSDLVSRLPILLPVYSTAPVINAQQGPWWTIVVTNGTGFTLNAPTNPPGPGSTQQLTIEVLNSSGGAMGTITWNGAFVFPTGAWSNPANGKRRFARFEWNGSKWLCTSLASADY